MRKGKLSLARAEDLQFLEKSCKIERNADVAELADAPDLGSGGQPCRFKSCRPHHVIHLLQSEPLRLDSNRCFSIFCDKTAAIERFLAILAATIKNCIWTVNQQNLSFRSVNHESSMI